MKQVIVEIENRNMRRTYIAKGMYANYEDLRNYINMKFNVDIPETAPTWWMDSVGYDGFKEGCKLLNYEILEHYIEKVEERG